MTTNAPAPAPLHRLRPRTPPVPPVVHRADVTPLEWAGLHRDGLLAPLWLDAARVTTHPEDPAVRAAALHALVPHRAAVGRRSAAWVHTGGAPPPRVDVLVRTRARRPDPHPDRRTHEADLAQDDVVDLGEVRVTTVLRTALDVARWLPADDAVPVLRALVGVGLDTGRALRLLTERSGGRGVRGARTVLARVDAERGASCGPAEPCRSQARIAGSSAPRDPVIR